MPRSEPAGPPPREIELKVPLDRAGLAALRGHRLFAGAWTTAKLRSVYYDTPRHALWRAGLTLRVREQDGVFEQTVKQIDDSSVLARGEWTAPLALDRPDLRALEATPAAATLDGEAVSPVFVTTVRRVSRVVRRGASRIEISIDEGEIVADGRRSPILELELELKAGEPAALFALARDLGRKSPLRLSFVSKAGRGYDLATGRDLDPAKGAGSPVRREMCAADAFRAIARGCLDQAAANAERLLRSRSPEALHQLRVGLRRLRAALSVFGPALEPEASARVAAGVRALARQLDQARDLDVFIEDSFHPAAVETPTEPGFTALGKALARARTEAYRRALGAAGGEAFSSLLLDTAEWLATGDWGPPGEEDWRKAGRRSAPSFAREALARLRHKVRACGKDLASLDSEHRHKVRIRVKKLRYATEFISPLFARKGAASFARKLERLQEALGELNDITVARAMVARTIGTRGGKMALAAGRTIGRREAAEPGLVTAAAHAFRKFEQAPMFWT